MPVFTYLHHNHNLISSQIFQTGLCPGGLGLENSRPRPLLQDQDRAKTLTKDLEIKTNTFSKDLETKRKTFTN